MKTMDKSSVVKNALARKVVTEKHLLERVAQSPFCLRLHATYMDENFIYILTEVAECGDLMEHMINLNIIPYINARYYTACLCLGIAHCHQAKFVHRDVKPENCLVFANGRVKLGDFGLSKELPYSVDLGDGTRSVCTLAFTMCGTPEFLAPEFIFSRGYDQRVDWWAFGCVLYEMLFAASPFVTNDLKTTFTRICDAASGKLPSNMKDDLSQTDESAASFLRGLICNKETRLAGSGNLGEITEHQYFDNFRWDQFRAETMKPPPVPPNKVLEAKPDFAGFFQNEISPFEGDNSEFAGFI